MTKPAACAGPGVRALMARTVLMVSVAGASFSGCACERPRRAARIGTEVPRVRVKLGTDVHSVAVAVQGKWRLTGREGTIASGKRLDWTPVTVSGGNVVFGRIATANGPVELTGSDDDPVGVSQTVGGRSRLRRYRGTLRIAPTTNGAVRLVNTVPMEAYLAGVLAIELYKGWHVEAYKAQCIAGRTYALMERNGRRRYDFDVYDSTRSQAYGGLDTETDTAWDAVEATWGVVATCRATNGKHALFKTLYHSTCGGDTVPAGSVYGGSTAAPLVGGTRCTFCRNSSRYRWPTVVLTKRQISEAVRRSGSASLAALGPVGRVEVATRTGRGGRAEQIRIVDTAGKAVLCRAAYWRTLVGASKVPSTWFTIEDRGDRIALTGGRGYGHGVGMCQWGAQYLATHGKTGEEILRYYYPGVELVRVY